MFVLKHIWITVCQVSDECYKGLFCTYSVVRV